jgi:hypothetical protein
MADINSTLSKESLHELFEYRDGKLIRKNTTASNALAGTEAGTFDASTGYYRVYINGKKERVHRIIFLMHHGYLPKYIDHIDNDRKNNRIENLREATFAENCQNASRRKDNSSGYKNVIFSKNTNTWYVRIRANGELLIFRGFKSVQQANEKAIQVRSQIHKNFARND